MQDKNTNRALAGETTMQDLSLITTRPSEFVAQADTDAHVVELWLHGRSRHTQRAYRAASERFLEFTAKTLRETTLGDVQAWLDSLCSIADSSRAQALAAVKSLLGFSHRIGYIRFNVSAVVKLPKIKNTLAERILPESEVHRMFALEPSPRNRLILRTLYYSGLRVSELCGLRWRDLQARGEEGQMTVFGKGAKTRAVLLPAGLWKEIESSRGEAGADEPVFRSRVKGGPLDLASTWLSEEFKHLTSHHTSMAFHLATLKSDAHPPFGSCDVPFSFLRSEFRGNGKAQLILESKHRQSIHQS
ncbi:MAG: hypothetical protein DMF61_25835 [Blastocatellia bacterium AA13]|nr:MAG: hypothetical protein DMF61_25835 [Blastocatellia bacterium AA13]